MNKQEKLIKQIEVLLTELKKESGISILPVSTSKNQVQMVGNFSGLTNEIFNLISEGFFDDPKSLSDIQRKLKEDGINKETTTLMKQILSLIRKKILGRNRPEKGPYQYYRLLK